MELVELSSSTESSPMQNMATPPRIEVNTPSGRVMRHCDPVSEVLLVVGGGMGFGMGNCWISR